MFSHSPAAPVHDLPRELKPAFGTIGTIYLTTPDSREDELVGGCRYVGERDEPPWHFLP